MTPSPEAVARLALHGWVRWPGALDLSTCAHLSAAAETVCALAASHPPPGYQATATSTPVPAAASAQTAPAEGFEAALWWALAPLSRALDALESLALDTAAAVWGRPAVAVSSQRWLRRQYPPGAAPGAGEPAPVGLHRFRAPHGWHQDGALGFDFAAHAQMEAVDGGPPAPAVPRTLLTLWVPLGPCGVDAPGLEWVPQRQTALWRPPDLTPARVAAWLAAQPDAACSSTAPTLRPALAAGEAVLFAGDLLHRTAVDPSMTRVRTSLELRVEAAPGLERERAPEREPRRAGAPETGRKLRVGALDLLHPESLERARGRRG